jgi:hypothetical protein
MTRSGFRGDSGDNGPMRKPHPEKPKPPGKPGGPMEQNRSPNRRSYFPNEATASSSVS